MRKDIVRLVNQLSVAVPVKKDFDVFGAYNALIGLGRSEKKHPSKFKLEVSDGGSLVADGRVIAHVAIGNNVFLPPVSEGALYWEGEILARNDND